MTQHKGILFRVFGLLIFTIVILFIGLSVSFYIFRDTIIEKTDIPNDIISEIIKHFEKEDLFNPESAGKLRQLIKGFSESPFFFRLSILNRDGIVVASTENEMIDLPIMNDMIMYTLSRGKSFPMERKYGKTEVIEQAYPIKSKGAIVGALLVSQYPESQIQQHTPKFPKFSVVLMILLGVMVIVIFGIYLNRFFSSLGKLSGTISNFAQGNYEERLNLNPDSEFGLIAESFNQIAETMENRIRESEYLNRILEKSNKEKEKHLKVLAQMAGGVAHEIRNPLGGIRGFAELLKSEMNEDDSKNKYIDYILKEVKSLEKLVQSVLDFARPKKPVYSKTQLSSIVEFLLPVIERKIHELEKSGVKISLDIIIDESVDRIEADESQLRQLFLNLLINGCDAMDVDGGTLSFTARPLNDEEIQRFSELEHIEEYILIKIADSGCGIDQEILENLFTPFYTTKAKGTGLGLSICQRIVEIHRGFIEVTSENKSGTAFNIYIPRRNLVPEIDS